MKTYIYDERRETMPREELELFQFEHLQSTIHRVWRNVQFYGRVFKEANITPDDFRSLADIHRLPFTTRQDLRESYPYGMFAVPLREIRRVHSSSGSTGMPIVVGYTANDLEHWTALVARNLAAAGVDEDDIVQIFFGYGMFSGGFGLHQGAERVGAAVLPASNADIRKQIATMQDFRTTVLVGTPSYARQMAGIIEESGLSPQSLSLRAGLFGAEQWSEHTREVIEKDLLIDAFDIYGLAELGGPGVAGECPFRCGLHLAEDHFYPEIIDPVTAEPLADGEEGELVLTSIHKEAFPLIRYRTGDITSLDRSPCECGRTHARISRIARRADDMIIVHGMKIFPGDVQAIIESMEEIGPRFRIVLDSEKSEDTMEVQIELSKPPVGGVLSGVDAMKEKVQAELQKDLRVPVRVRFVEPSSLATNGDKARLVQDHRRP